MSRCLGRLVRDAPKGEYLLPFEGGAGQFHLPIRCDRVAGASGDGLCERCAEKEVRTAAKAAAIPAGGTTIGGMLPTYLHGRVTEPIPFWSRLYDGAWYRLKVAAGCRISEDTMGRVKKAVAEVYADVGAPPEPVPLPAGGGKRGPKAGGGGAAAAKGKTLAERRAELRQTTLVPVPAPAPATPPTAAPAAPKKRAPKKAGVAPAAAATPPELAPPVAVVPQPTRLTPVEDVLTIQVQRRTIDGRELFVDPQKEKVYDLKFRYIGRHDRKADRIVPFPDSDAE